MVENGAQKKINTRSVKLLLVQFFFRKSYRFTCLGVRGFGFGIFGDRGLLLQYYLYPYVNQHNSIDYRILI